MNESVLPISDRLNENSNPGFLQRNPSKRHLTTFNSFHTQNTSTDFAIIFHTIQTDYVPYLALKPIELYSM